MLFRSQGYDPKLDRKQPKKDDEEPSDPDQPDGENGQQREDLIEPSEREDFRLLLVTDLGILVKRSLDGSQEVFVQSIATGLPVAGADVEVIGKNGLTLFTQTTDATGRVRFAKLDTEAHPQVSMRHHIKGIPSLILFKNRATSFLASPSWPCTTKTLRLGTL